MAIQLTITDRRNPGDTFTRTFIDNRVLIGRSRTCHICLPDLSVSSIHTEIGLQGKHYTAKDTGSVNGTWIDGKKLIAHRPKRLENDMVIRVTHYDVAFRLGVTAQGMPDRNLSQEQAREMLAAILAGEEIHLCPALVVISGPGRAARFELPPQPSCTTLGKGRQNHIVLEDRDILRQHATITYDENTITVAPTGPRAILLKDDDPVTHLTLQQGDTFTVGETTLGLEHPLDPTLLAIQGAPEEETSSFSPSAIVNDAPPEANEIPTEPTAPSPSAPPLPTGPADPLLARETADYVKTQEIPMVEGEEKSDMGLIVVGAIIVILCVLGLVALLT